MTREKGCTMTHESEMLRRRISSERDSAAAGLRSELRALKHRVDAALSRIESGRQIDGHMIHNASMITADIARWNLLIELAPYIEGLP